MSEIEFFTKADGVYSVFNDEHCIAIAKANRLIKERSQVVYVDMSGNDPYYLNEKSYLHDKSADPEMVEDYTHRALLIGVEPIVNDTAESLLRAILKEHFADKFQTPLIDRARALLAKGGKDE